MFVLIQGISVDLDDDIETTCAAWTCCAELKGETFPWE